MAKSAEKFRTPVLAVGRVVMRIEPEDLAVFLHGDIILSGLLRLGGALVMLLDLLPVGGLARQVDRE